MKLFKKLSGIIAFSFMFSLIFIYSNAKAETIDSSTSEEVNNAKDCNPSPEFKYVKIAKDKYIRVKDLGNKDSEITVVLSSAYGDGIYHMIDENTSKQHYEKIQNDLVAAGYRVIVYDRLGLGESSDISNFPAVLTDEQINLYLENKPFNFDFTKVLRSGLLGGKTAYNRGLQFTTLIKNLGVKGKVICAPHSISGWEVDYAATEVETNPQKYDYDIVGVVGIDITWPTNPREVVNWLKVSIPSMLNDYIGQFTNQDGNLSEVIISGSMLENSNNKHNIPLTLLHSIDVNNPPELQALSDAGTQFWLNRFVNVDTKQQNVYSNHYIMEDDPDSITNAILEMIEQVKN